MPQLHATPEGGVFNLIITVTKTKQAVSFKTVFMTYDYRFNTGGFNKCIYYCSALGDNTGETRL